MEQDLVQEEADAVAWPPPYPRSYDEDFRAHPTVVNGFVPSDHPTHEQELIHRRQMIYALNRQLKAREEMLLGEYIARLAHRRLRVCIDSSARETVRRGFDRFREVIRCLDSPSRVSSLQ